MDHQSDRGTLVQHLPSVLKQAVPGAVRRSIADALALPQARSQYAAYAGRDSLDRYTRDIEAYWREHYGKPVSPSSHFKFTQIAGVNDVRYIPHSIWWDSILPHFNSMSTRPAFLDKNLADTFLGSVPSAATVLKRVRGHYFDSGNRPIKRAHVWAWLQEYGSETPAMIAKPSTSDDGFRITRVSIDSGRVMIGDRSQSLGSLEDLLGSDFLIQEKLVQHKEMAMLHPASVNTLRVVTLRLDEQIRHLGTFARFGTGGSINDNAGSGGVVAGVSANGWLHDAAITKTGQSFSHHPTTNIPFASVQVPGWDRVPEFAIDLHGRVLHHDLISWDIVVLASGEPAFLEMNFRGASYIYQWALRRPIFGELTERVLEAVKGARGLRA